MARKKQSLAKMLREGAAKVPEEKALAALREADKLVTCMTEVCVEYARKKALEDGWTVATAHLDRPYVLGNLIPEHVMVEDLVKRLVKEGFEVKSEIARVDNWSSKKLLITMDWSKA